MIHLLEHDPDPQGHVSATRKPVFRQAHAHSNDEIMIQADHDPGSGIVQGRTRSKVSVARALSLAAAPIFAIMAVRTGVSGDAMDTLCATGHPSALSGMALMYWLMSVVHLPPWLKLGSGLRNARR